MIKAILFDLDETLISHSQQLRLFIRTQYNKYEQLKRIPFENWEERFVTLDQNGYVTKDVVYNKLVEEFSIQTPSSEELYNHFIEEFHYYVVPFPNAEKILVRLRNHGIKTGIITNGGHLIQTRKIKQIGFQKLVDVILTSEEMGTEKPDSEIFLHAVKKLNVAPENCLFVGDHPVNDVAGAKRAGMTAAWVKNGKRWTETEFSPDYTLEDLLKIQDFC